MISGAAKAVKIQKAATTNNNGLTASRIDKKSRSPNLLLTNGVYVTLNARQIKTPIADKIAAKE